MRLLVIFIRQYFPYIVVFLVLLAITVFVFAAILQHRGFYKKTKCDLCGSLTGYKGNRRYKLIGGFMCEHCAAKLAGSAAALESKGPNWFMVECPYGTVDDAMKRIQDVKPGEVEYSQPKQDTTPIQGAPLSWQATSDSNDMKNSNNKL